MTRSRKPSDPAWIAYAAALRRRRQALGMTILDLSCESGITTTEISVLERGLAMPRVRTLIAWRVALRLPPVPAPDW
jgi:transcriptional regulator with XRE-family HTH domain